MAEFTEVELKCWVNTENMSDTAMYSVSNASSLTSAYLLSDESVTSFNQLLWENNSIILDEPYITDTRAETSQYGFMSYTVSDAEGHFSTETSVSIIFPEYHRLLKTAIKFMGYPAYKTKFEWYFGGMLLKEEILVNDEQSMFLECDSVFTKFDKLKVTFLETAPNKYVRVANIIFGSIYEWHNNDITQASLIKSLSRVGDLVATDTLTASIVDKDNRFNFANPNGLYDMFEPGQKIRAIEYLDDKTIDLGTYYLKSFASADGVGKINAISLLGQLEYIPYNNGSIYNGVRADTIIQDIFSVAKVNHYTIDSYTASRKLYGTIAPCSCKEALQHVLFACNSSVLSTVNDTINIGKYDYSVAYEIPRRNKISTKVESSSDITGVSLTYNDYVVSTEVDELVKGVYQTDSAVTISFKVPHTNLCATNATIKKSSAYSVTFLPTSTSEEVVISGNAYTAIPKTITHRMSLEGVKDNIVSFETHLCNYDTAKDLAKSLFDYYKNNLTISIQHYAEDSDLNLRVNIQNSSKELKGFIGLFTERNFDLTGGFLDSAKLVAQFNVADNYYYAGSEVYGYDNILL